MRRLLWWSNAVQLVVVAATVAIVLARVDAVFPPEEGPGAFPSQAPAWTAAGVSIAVPIAGMFLHLFAADYDRGARSVAVNWVVTAVGIAGAIVVGWPLGDAQPTRVTVTDAGFESSGVNAIPGRPLTFRNARAEPITICVGADGRCDVAAAGPPSLRGEGLLVPANHRTTAGRPPEGTVSVTLAGVGPDVPNRTMWLSVTWPETQ